MMTDPKDTRDYHRWSERVDAASDEVRAAHRLAAEFACQFAALEHCTMTEADIYSGLRDLVSDCLSPPNSEAVDYREIAAEVWAEPKPSAFADMIRRTPLSATGIARPAA